MARQLIEQITDDMDGTKADTTVAFSWDGTAYEIDLSRKNAAAFEKILKPYLAKARKVRAGGGARRTARSGRSTRPGGPSSARRPSRDLAAVRVWARDNGHEVSERGRISTAVLQAYDAEH